MKTTKILALLLSLVILAFMPKVVGAAGNPSLQLSVKPSKVIVGQQFTVEILVKNAPLIYGADVHLTFDTKALEVIDADPTTDGIQFQAGSFIDPAKSYPLQYQVDNENGTIDYALTLLNPAPDAHGNGQLALVTFQAKAAGKTMITISEGMFGTRSGETISPDLDSVQVTVMAQTSATTNTPTSGKTWLFAGLGIVALAGISIGVVLFLHKRRHNK
jgi:hypothetical protein